MAERLALDTNVLVYAVDRDAGSRHFLARRIIHAAAILDCVLTLRSLAELFLVLTRKRPPDAGDAKHIVAA